MLPAGSQDTRALEAPQRESRASYKPHPTDLVGLPNLALTPAPRQCSPGVAWLGMAGHLLEQHPWRTSRSAQERGCLELRCWVSMKTMLKIHPWEPLELPFHGVTPRAATLGSNVRVPISTKYPRLFPLPGWVSTFLSLLQPGGRNQCCLGLPIPNAVLTTCPGVAGSSGMQHSQGEFPEL